MNTENQHIIKKWTLELKEKAKSIKEDQYYGGISTEVVLRAKKSDGYWYECRQNRKKNLEEIRVQIKCLKLMSQCSFTITEYGRTQEIDLKSWNFSELIKTIKGPLSEWAFISPLALYFEMYDTGQRGLEAQVYRTLVKIGLNKDENGIFRN